MEADSGEELQQFEGEEIFHVDWGQKKTLWRLPDFPTFISVEAAGGLGQISVVKNNLETLMVLSNRTRGQNGPQWSAMGQTEQNKYEVLAAEEAGLGDSKEPTPLPETTENVLCGLGLAIGILGIITGTVLFFKAMRMNNHNSRSRGGL
ncbi:hypothetical protein JD844_013989 [Phrynosoma platyrhinos]|uniref:MHC class II alpha chain N-terminal domain-containing protein n=1 Tax=Phrynosoma platyrhinos TaxID=52577 RepID=A0ABQ7TNI0_PHRPL|nr:hypothetical protein JD844_013989 [Phrynosoma platyrhinos]